MISGPSVPVHCRIPNPHPDNAERCGHNFPVLDCPFEFCGYRDTLILLDELVQAISDLAAKRDRDMATVFAPGEVSPLRTLDDPKRPR